MDEELLQIFCTNIALCAKNIDLVSELRRDAFVDRQLSLPNRTALVCELNERIQAGREKGQCLVVLDLDQFAAVNDVLGHDHGDALPVAKWPSACVKVCRPTPTLPGFRGFCLPWSAPCRSTSRFRAGLL